MRELILGGKEEEIRESQKSALPGGISEIPVHTEEAKVEKKDGELIAK